MSNLLEIYDLMEWNHPWASKEFWADAKEGKLNDEAFRTAYKDELNKLGLWDLIDSEHGGTGVLKEKGSYGAIKKASEENPDSWAIKALLKMWVLQFKDNVKSASQLKQEERAATEAALKVTWDAMQEKRPFVEETINKIGLEYASKQKDIIVANLKEVERLGNELSEITKGMYHHNSVAYMIEQIENKVFKAEISMQKSWSREQSYTVLMRVEVVGYVGETPYFRTKTGSYLENTFTLSPEELSEEIIREKLLKILTALDECIFWQNDRLDRIKADHAEIVGKINASKAAQAAVNAGKPVDPDFIAEVVAIFKNGLKKANAEYASWARWKYDDGDSGAAFAMEQAKTMDAAGICLLNCNWRSYVNDREIAVWRTSDSMDAFETALVETFNATCDELNIEIIK